MECPECGQQAIVAYKREYRQQQGEPISEIRAYVCLDETCLNSFAYRNTYMGQRERMDAKKFIRQYKTKNRNPDQEELFEED